MTLSRDKLDTATLECPEGWALSADKTAITRRFVFKNFSEAFAFMTRCALAAEKLDHHPDWSNSYKTVNISLSTHDSGGITAFDIKLAKQFNRYGAAAAA